jgi:homocysteine S-methyltransferase
MDDSSPLAPFLERSGVVVLDGGLATTLQDRGYDLDDPLWSARLLLTRPDAVREVHRDYLDAGADCLITATYQASIPGLQAEGLSEERAARLLRDAVATAREARDEFFEGREQPDEGRARPIVAASVGPYGAYLADGSEYRGNYRITRGELLAFHEPRWEALIDSEADLLACETIPSAQEAEVLLGLLEQTPGFPAWVSFSCRDGERISDGTPLSDCVALFEECDSVIAVGVNCTAPRHVNSLIERVRHAAPTKRVVVYPNSGQTYDAERREWVLDPSD